jgi:hypothetical protein
MKIFDEVTEPMITATLQFKLAVALSFFQSYLIPLFDKEGLEEIFSTCSGIKSLNPPLAKGDAALAH